MAHKYTLVETGLQLLAAFHLGCLQNLYATVLFFIIYVTFFTKYWPIVPLSILWMWYDRETPIKGGRRLKLFTEIPYLKHLIGYFSMSMVKMADLDPNKNYIFCCHPHGLLSTAQFINFALGIGPGKQLFPGFKINVSSLDCNMVYPIFREIAMGCGLISASKESFNNLLNDSQRGNIVSLIVGGAEEVGYALPGQYKIIIKKRKGFVKLALTLGCGLVPVINFGENDIYDLIIPKKGTIFYKIHVWLKRTTGLFIVFPMGKFGLPFLPKRKPLTVVVGKPIEMPKIATPSQEDIDEYHKLYTQELMKLFNEHKHKYVNDPENTHLEFVG